MNRILFSAAAGALAMYFFDPQGGRRRRARARDKVDHAARRLRDAYDVTARDTRQRAVGMKAELRAMSDRLLRRGGPVSGDTLVGRVRAVLGRYVSHPHAIEVSASGGEVALSGPILAHEVPGLLYAVKHVPGVRGVENRLELHKEPGNISSLQGGLPRRGQQWELLQDNWSPAARLLTGALGLALLLRGGVIGRIGGAALLAHKTICVSAPVEQVFAFWSDYQNFPRFMSNVREVRLDGDRSHWVVSGPAGVPVEWDAEVMRIEPNSLIQWHSTPRSAVKQEGEVRFEPMADGGTRVTVHMCYLPPAGALGHAVARIFGADPKSEMDADLMRMKSMIETGHAPHDAAQRA